MKKDEIEENYNSNEIKVTSKNNKNKPIGNPTQQSKGNNIKNKTSTKIIKSNNHQSKLWNQNKYDIGSWTKSKLMKLQQNKVNLQQSTIIKTNNFIQKETTVNKIKDVPNPWETIVDKVPNNPIHPIEIIPSTTPSLSSLTNNNIPKPKKKINNIVDIFIKSWENKLKETK